MVEPLPGVEMTTVLLGESDGEVSKKSDIAAAFSPALFDATDGAILLAGGALPRAAGGGEAS